MDAASALTETPQTFAATSIGTALLPDVVAVDLERDRQVVEDILEVHADERWDASPTFDGSATRRAARLVAGMPDAVAGVGGLVVLHADRLIPSAATAAAILSEWLFILFSLLLDY